MKKASQKFKTYIGQARAIADNGFRHKMLVFILLSFGFLVICYGVIFGSMVLNIAKHRSLDKEMIFLANEVSSLELVYLSKSGKVDLNLSKVLGFREIKPAFATRQSFTMKSSLIAGDNEI